MSDFDFDYLKQLYIDDPIEFEKVTHSMVVETIDSFPDNQQDVFRAKQWRLEQDLGKVKDPLERMNRMVALFWVQVAEFTNAVETFGVPPKDIKPNKPCSVIDFNKKD